MPRQIAVENPYRDKLLKLIPSEVVAAYLFVDGLASTGARDNPKLAQWTLVLASLFLLVMIWPYLRRFQHVHSPRQIVFTMLSFVIWLYALGGPFRAWNPSLHVPWLGSILLALWTLLIPFFVEPPPEKGMQAGRRP